MVVEKFRNDSVDDDLFVTQLRVALRVREKQDTAI